ncbi:solute carrier family 41 member 1-like [Lutzomyia longipalpis]|uniref:solute carrier family 41 member 1-like n=1 Tax=Lutzomyia longipalpis TaxID=7200 RepID=UPI002484280A|nr:solute carrier family 41 member 1-like [Lutzomyia longipalpis]
MASNTTDQSNTAERSLDTNDSSNATSNETIEDGQDENFVNPEKRLERIQWWWDKTLYVLLPLLIAAIGTIGAGLVFGAIDGWPVFQKVTELFIILPSLMGLKGNLDMNLASRFCKQVNVDNLKDYKFMLFLILGNICYVQIQAIIASFAVAIFALTVNAAINQRFSVNNSVILIATSMFTATTTCFILDIVLIAAIILTKRFSLDPDKLLTPIANCIGDLVCLALLAAMATALYETLDGRTWISYIVILIYILILPFWVYVVIRNKFMGHVLMEGLRPIVLGVKHMWTLRYWTDKGAFS